MRHTMLDRMGRLAEIAGLVLVSALLLANAVLFVISFWPI